MTDPDGSVSVTEVPEATLHGDFPVDIPPLARKCEAVAAENNFQVSSEPRTGALLRTLAASKPGGRMLELGSGVGVGSAWLLAGMDKASRLITVEREERNAAACRLQLAVDSRAEVINAEATEWLAQYSGPPFDLVFADATAPKFERRDLLFQHLKIGALFIGDDLLPQETWSPPHAPRVARFRQDILKEPMLVPTMLDWASGLLVAAYRPA